MDYTKQQPISQNDFYNQSTNVMQQQPQKRVKFQLNNDWSSGLMGCCEDTKLCCCVCCCPCFNACEVDKAIGVCLILI